MWCNSTASAYIMPFIVCYTKRIAVYPGRHLRFFEICWVWLWATDIDVYLELQTISLLCGRPSYSMQRTYKPLSPQGIMVAWETLDCVHKENVLFWIHSVAFYEMRSWILRYLADASVFPQQAHNFISFHFVNYYYFPSIWLRLLLFAVLESENVATICALYEICAKLSFHFWRLCLFIYLFIFANVRNCKTSHNGHCKCTSHIAIMPIRQWTKTLLQEHVKSCTILLLQLDSFIFCRKCAWASHPVLLTTHIYLFIYCE